MAVDSIVTTLSNQLADAVAFVAPSVVQVHGAGRPASGIVYGPDVIMTTMRALGREDGLRIRASDGRALDAELAGWDPATGLAVVRTPGLGLAAVEVADAPARVGHLGIAVARSWSNALTASAGIVSVIGGPLPTGRRRSIDEVIRTTAPMHDGFAGGAFIDTTGRLIGVATAAAIRGLAVVIPAKIAWKTAAAALEHGRVKRGFLGLAGQPVRLTERQRVANGRDQALLVVAVTPNGPADAAGLLVGDVVLDFDGHPIEAPEDLLDLLAGDPVGTDVPVRVLRAKETVEVNVRVGQR